MLSARIHDYQKPLTIENIEKPVITKGEQVLVKVGAISLLKEGKIEGRAVIVP